MTNATQNPNKLSFPYGNQDGKGVTLMKKKIEDYVRTIPDFPEPGIMFRDVTSVIQDPDGLKLAIDSIQKLLKDVDFDIIVGAESRGFIFGAPIAYWLSAGTHVMRWCDGSLFGVLFDHADEL